MVEPASWVRYVPGETVVDADAKYVVIGRGGGSLVMGLYVANRQPVWIMKLPPLPSVLDVDTRSCME